MYCQKCGTENPEGIQLCQSCSWVLAGNSTVALSPDAKTSGLAITALVLMILTPFTFFLTAIPAIIFGIIALVKIEKSGGSLKGKGFAIAGIAAPAALAPFALLMGILMPALFKVKCIAQRTVCGTNLKQISVTMQMYAQDNDDNYPTASKWCDLLIENCDIDEKTFRCISASEGPCNYAMNPDCDPYSPGYVVLLFESRAGWNQSGGLELLTTENHHGEGCNVLFNDGHVRFIKSDDVNNLKWTTGQKMQKMTYSSRL